MQASYKFDFYQFQNFILQLKDKSIKYKNISDLVFDNYSNITLMTCNFNNDTITGLMLQSFFKQVNWYIPTIIVDNSNTHPISDNYKTLFNVFDNTNFKCTPDYKNASKNHASSIDYILKNHITTDYVLLCDNDVLFKPEILQLLQQYTNYDAIGEVGKDWCPPDRLFPYCCIINVAKFKKEHLSYFDNMRCCYEMAYPVVNKIVVNNKVIKTYNKLLFDTGASFYEDIRYEWNIHEIKLSDYIIHYQHGSSLHEKTTNKELFNIEYDELDTFLENNKNLWMI